MNATLVRLAELCAMDPSTVSRALRDDPRVKSTTRERIKALATTMGYAPNLAARTLVSGRTGILVFLMSRLGDAIELEPAKAVHASAEAAGYDLLIGLYSRIDGLARQLARAAGGGADGIILIPPVVDGTAGHDACAMAKTPLVFLDRPVDGVDAPWVTSSNEAAAAGLVSRCADAGYRRIAILFGAANAVERERARGARAEATRLGLEQVEADPADGAPIAFVASAAATVRTCFAALSGRMGQTPARTGAGVFDVWPGDAHPFADVFVCAQDFPAMATTACAVLLDRLAGRDRPERRIEIPIAGFTRLA